GRGASGDGAARPRQGAGRAHRGAGAADAGGDEGGGAADDRRQLAGEPRGPVALLLSERGLPGRRARLPREAQGQLAGPLERRVSNVMAGTRVPRMTRWLACPAAGHTPGTPTTLILFGSTASVRPSRCSLVHMSDRRHRGADDRWTDVSR